MVRGKKNDLFCNYYWQFIEKLKILSSARIHLFVENGYLCFMHDMMIHHHVSIIITSKKTTQHSKKNRLEVLIYLNYMLLIHIFIYSTYEFNIHV